MSTIDSTPQTTNYDVLLESAFQRHGRVDVKSTDEAISRGISGSEIEVVKMHGCIFNSGTDDIVATQEDYEDFFVRRPATSQRLTQDLLGKSFLFIGYAYGDSNINNILVEARRLGRRFTRQHFIVLRRIKHKDEAHRESMQMRQDLWIRDLARLGIEACQIDEYHELETLLNDIAIRSRGNTIFVTGGHLRSEEAGSVNSLRHLGELLAAEKNLTLLDGQSVGTSRAVVSSYMERCISRKEDIRNRLQVFANPYAANPNLSNDASLLPTLKEWRTPLLRSANVVLVYHGGMGTLAEVELAKEFGCRIVPVPENIGDLPSRLLDDPEIGATLQSVDAEYFTKAKTCNLKPEEILLCVQKMLAK